MKTFTGFDYLLIDAANSYGLDKVRFEDRIEWATTNLQQLELLASQAEQPSLFIKACMAIRRAQAGEPIGHLVAFDAVCSGIQIMSVMTGCLAGATATGLVDPDRRADAYTELTGVMNVILETKGMAGVSFPRADVKQALMTSAYGSQAVPKELFGVETPELEAFYEGGQQVAPGAFDLMGELLDSWQPYALSHEWKLPDGFLCRVKVMETVETRIEVDELDHMTFTYEYKDNVGQKKGRANVANVTHSVDGFILRELIRRCSYDREQAQYVHSILMVELLERAMMPVGPAPIEHEMIQYYVDHYEASQMASVVILPYLNDETVQMLSYDHLKALMPIVEQMLTYMPFSVITIHDSFSCHPNHMNHVRYWYKEILAELADSEILSDILSQIHGSEGTYPKMIPNLSTYIRQSNYALS